MSNLRKLAERVSRLESERAAEVRLPAWVRAEEGELVVTAALALTDRLGGDHERALALLNDVVAAPTHSQAVALLDPILAAYPAPLPPIGRWSSDDDLEHWADRIGPTPKSYAEALARFRAVRDEKLSMR